MDGIRRGLDDEPTEIGRLGEAMRRLLPALERAVPGDGTSCFPAVARTDPAASPLPDQGAGLDAVVAELEELIDHGCAVTAPGWLGYITTGPTTSGVLAQTAMSLAGGQRYLHHSFNDIEWIALRWLAELCGIPPGAAGVFTSGGSTANLVALGAARQAAYEAVGIDIAEVGTWAAPPGRIYVSTRGHRTIHRSAAALGLGRASVTDIAADTAGHIDTKALAQAMDADRAAGVVPIAVVAVAGSTDTGSVDPVAEVVRIARDHGSWVHVDGAYGLIANASPELAPRFEGVADADSWIVDPHKWLATGVGVGAVYVRRGELLEETFDQGHSDYIEGGFNDDLIVSQFDSLSGPWADQALELSAPPRGVLVWAVLREIGRAGVARRVERHVALARYLADQVRAHPRLELLCEPDLSIACFRYVPEGSPSPAGIDDVNSHLLEQLRRTTATVPSSTVVDGHFALRPCFINPRVRRVEADELLRACVEIGDRLAAQAPGA